VLVQIKDAWAKGISTAAVDLCISGGKPRGGLADDREIDEEGSRPYLVNPRLPTRISREVYF
jgi:hypothetical protein